MAKIISMAVNPQSIETQNFRSTRSKHRVNGFIVDGDYMLVKTDKRTFMKTSEYVWNEVTPPFDVPAEVKGIPTLVNPDNLFYTWIEKPEKYHPCWFAWQGANLTIISMVTGKILGHSIPLRGTIIVGGLDNGMDVWKEIRDTVDSLLPNTVFPVAEFIGGTKSRILQQVPNFQYWYSIAHGSYYSMLLNQPTSSSDQELLSTDIAKALVGKAPYIFAFIDTCGAMNHMADGITWSLAFTKDQIGHIVVGLKNFSSSMPAGPAEDYVQWSYRLFTYFGSGYSVRNAYENALADYPIMYGYIDIFEGRHTTPQEPQNLVVIVSPSGAGYVTPVSGFYDTNVNIQAFPYSGYRFKWFTVDDSISPGLWYATDNPYQTVLGAGIRTVTACFVLQLAQYTLTVAVSPTGSGSVTPTLGSHTYTNGDTVSFYAVPNAGYVFDHWIIERSSTGTIWNYASGQIIIDGNITMTAYFRLIATPSINYSIRINPQGGGTTTPAPGTYTTTGPISLNAVPATGYKFTRWDFIINGTVVQSETSPSLSNLNLDMNAILTQFGNNPTVVFTAQFESTAAPSVPGNIALTLVVSPIGSGITIPAVGTHSYPAWSEPTVSAYPNPGYAFDHWHVTQPGGATDYYTADVDTVLNLDTTMTAYLKVAAITKYNLVTSVDPAGSGTVSPTSGSYNLNTSISIVATTLPGYVFDHWSGDATGTSPQLNITMTRNMNIVANFRAAAAKTHILTVNIIGSGTVIPNGGTFGENGIVVLLAEPMPGWQFASWGGTYNNAINPTSVIMDTDKTITVTFTKTTEEKQPTSDVSSILQQMMPVMMIGMMIPIMGKMSS